MHSGWCQQPYYNQLYSQWMQYFHQLYLNQHVVPYFETPISYKKQIETQSVMIQAPHDLIELNKDNSLPCFQKDYNSFALKIQQKIDNISKKGINQIDNSTQSRHQRRNSIQYVNSQLDQKEKINKTELKKILKKPKNLSQRNSEDQILIQQDTNSNSKKKILKMLRYFSKDQKKYHLIVNQSKNDSTIEGEIIRFMDQRIKSFGKSKEEMTKAIIRRVQRYHKQSIKQTRIRQFMNFGGLKSMNRKYLTQIFSNPQFKKSYMEAYNDLQVFFFSDNKSKTKKLIQQINKIRNTDDLKSLDSYLNGKSKMPWPQCIMERLIKVMNELYNTYITQ